MLAIELEFLNAFLDVFESTMGTGLRRCLDEGLRVPSPTEFLHRAYILDMITKDRVKIYYAMTISKTPTTMR